MRNFAASSEMNKIAIVKAGVVHLRIRPVRKFKETAQRRCLIVVTVR